MEVREQLSKDCFMDSLNDHDLEWSVLQGRPKSVEDALKLALEYEAFQKGRRGRQGDLRPFRVQDQVSSNENNSNAEPQNGGHGSSVKPSGGSDQYAHTDSRRRKKCGFCQRLGHDERDCRQKRQLQSDGTCFYCDSPNHVIKYCEKRRRDMKNMGSSFQGQFNGQKNNTTSQGYGARKINGSGNGY